MRAMSLRMVYALAKEDSRILFIGSDLGVGVLNEFKQEMPDRFFMEGISEAHIIGMAAGLAKEGYIPYVNTIATFLTRRCFEQIAIDICLPHLPVRLIGNGGGLVYAPLGPTHLATDDIGLMRLLPNMTILVPCDAQEMNQLMMQTKDIAGPIYIRVAKGGEPIVSSHSHHYKIGEAILLKEAKEVLIVTMGVMVKRAIEVADTLCKMGIQCGILNIHTIKPLDENSIFQQSKNVELLVCLEEHHKTGGLGSAIIESFVNSHIHQLPPMLHLGIPNIFPENFGSQDELIQSFQMGCDSIVQAIKDKLNALH